VVRSDTEVCLESLVKACRSRGAQRVPDARVATPGEARGARVLHPAPLAAVVHHHRRAPAVVANNLIGSRAHRRSNKVAHSACCFDHPVLPT